MQIGPVTLSGAHVRLEPLSMFHLDGLCAAGMDPEIWRVAPFAMAGPADMRSYVERAIEGGRNKDSVPFATTEAATGRVVGSTRFMGISVADRRVEIGNTWIAPRWQRTAVNTEAKYLMLRHAFEVWKCIRVEFKTDSLNDKSRKAIARLGAVEEGTFRNHMITAGGRYRHSVFFSVIDSEWSGVKARLEARLRQGSQT